MSDTPHSQKAAIGPRYIVTGAGSNANHLPENTNSHSTAPRTRTDDAKALHRLALACVQDDDLERANTHIRRALKADAHNAELWEHAGIIAAARARYVCAEAYYHRAIGIAGNTASLHRNLADCLRLVGRLHEARDHYVGAIELEPDLHHANRATAQISDELGDTYDAVDYWERAWMLDSSNPQDAIDLICAFAKADRIDRLHEAVAETMARFGNRADVLQKLALALYKHDQFEDALNVATHGLKIEPGNAPLHHYAAIALSKSGRLAESLRHSIEAVRLWPDNPEMQYHLATLEIARGEFETGWARHKAFYSLRDLKGMLFPVDIPEWQGQSLAGCQFLLIGEQGDGDKIQCVRFAEWLHRQGATVDFLVTQPVAKVVSTMKCIRAVYFDEEPQGQYDYWTHLLKVPEHMRLSLNMLPAIDFPYMTAPPVEVQRWRTRIEDIAPAEGAETRRRIGVVWAGRPTYGADRFRSVDLDMFRPLFDVPDTVWFSVQKGPCERESEALATEFEIHTLGPAIEDFSDTLAILESLDLLITVDTSVAHLAGAAGRPVWVLVPAYVEWRWIAGRNDSAWYPSMRLFRQIELGNWGPVIDEVRDALQEWCAQRALAAS
jgi:Flp pilus assembly protein TadD